MVQCFPWEISSSLFLRGEIRVVYVGLLRDWALSIDISVMDTRGFSSRGIWASIVVFLP